MSTPEEYEARATQCDAQADREHDPWRRSEWQRIAKSYRQLAIDAARSGRHWTDPRPPPSEQPQVQQQQQIQPKDDVGN